jgi:hypothetical protein
VAETTAKELLCCGFRRTGKAMGQVYQLVEDMSRNKCFFQVQIWYVLGFVPICDLFADSPSYISRINGYMIKFSPVCELGIGLVHCNRTQRPRFKTFVTSFQFTIISSVLTIIQLYQSYVTSFDNT